MNNNYISLYNQDDTLNQYINGSTEFIITSSGQLVILKIND